MGKAVQKQANLVFWVVLVEYEFSQNEEALQGPKGTTLKR